MTIDKRALREVAERATQGPWKLFSDIDTKTFSIHTPRDKRCENVIKWGGFDCQPNAEANAEFIAAFNPKVALALLDENIQLQRAKDALEAVALALRDDMRDAREQLEEAEKQIVELSRAASVNSQWKPDVCPVTGRKFFMWIEHETLGYVPTYGGPFDSYTIPTRDSSGEFSCERYDHDVGGWVEGETIGLYLIDDDEQCRVCELEDRVAELEAEKAELRPVGVMSEKAFYRLEQSESRFITLCPRPGIHLPRKRPNDSVLVYARVAAAGIGKGE
ncbi:ead/Ea22-like family protein [Salmonella enterica subsp. enterica serovar Kentucky]